MALRAGAFPEKLGHSACSQPVCVGKDWWITHPIGQRCTDDQPTIKGRTSANFGYSKPLFACVHRTFGDQFLRRRVQFFSDAAASDARLRLGGCARAPPGRRNPRRFIPISFQDAATDRACPFV
jgi:hypothetical protein